MLDIRIAHIDGLELTRPLAGGQMLTPHDAVKFQMPDTRGRGVLLPPSGQ